MPFPHQSRLIAGLLQQFGEGGLRSVEAFPVAAEPVDVAVLAGQDVGAGRAADGIGAKGIQKHRALFGESIDVGSLIDLRTVGADGLDGVIVRKDEYDIGLLLGSQRAQAKNQGRQP